MSIYVPKAKENNHRFKQVQVCVLREAPTLYTSKKVNSPEKAAMLFADVLKEYDREHFIVVSLDSKLKPVNFNVVSIGDLNKSCASPANVFKPAILSNADAIMLLHNHPSGDVTPSESDVIVTKRLAIAGEILGIEVIDHIICGNGDYFSLKEEDCF